MCHTGKHEVRSVLHTGDGRIVSAVAWALLVQSSLRAGDRTVGKEGSRQRGRGATVVMLLPARTDTRWFHDYIYGKAEVRFVRGRLKFGGSKNSAPFPSMVVVFRPKMEMLEGMK